MSAQPRSAIWTALEWQHARDLAVDKNPSEIAADLHRTVNSVYAKFAYERQRNLRPTFGTKPLTVRQEQRLRRTADPFKLAMLTAIKAGLEHAVIGVFKDRRPMTVRSVPRPSMASSGCSSPALACAEIGIQSR